VKRLLIAVILLAGAGSARADLPVAIPYHLLLNADIVVSGVITDTSLQVAGNREYNTAMIHVVKVFAGPVTVGEDLEIIWENGPGICGRVTHERLKGTEAIWFLSSSGGRQYDANTNQRALPLRRDEMENFLTYFPRLHGPADTDLESLVVTYIRIRLDTLPAN